METAGKMEQSAHINLHKDKVHHILAHSYLFYFISFLVGLSLDFVFPIRIFKGSTPLLLGIALLALGTLLVVWAQRSSHNLKKENVSKEVFCRGPYCYTRSPTHFGLLFLMLGFGIIANALFVVVFSVVSFFVTKLLFLKKEEKILAEKYGAPYLEYKKSVKI